jgi:hypothetical protein
MHQIETRTEILLWVTSYADASLQSMHCRHFKGHQHCLECRVFDGNGIIEEAEFGGLGMSFKICRGTLGSLAILTAMRNASSRDIRFIAIWRSGSSSI